MSRPKPQDFIEVQQALDDLIGELDKLVADGPAKKPYGLAFQLRRSALSAAANLAMAKKCLEQ